MAVELLSPAGSFKGLIGAINAGCNAVYLGGTRFGARAYAENFTDDEIIKAIEYAHLFDVKIYLTVNTLIKESEFKDVLSYVELFYKAGLDGCIVQDLGLISVFQEHFPLMECHISTQAFVTGRYGCRFFKALGASRVVLARELSLNEIKEIKKSEDIEIETFIHGAMCYSYSGDCLFSSCLGGRSGNRGRCAGPCRLEYSVNDGKHESDPGFYLSMKDQCALPILPKLVDAGIDSLKIEGRMKKPEYTAFTTSVYRKYLDSRVNSVDSFKVSDEDTDNLKHMYLRSAIGTGYYEKNNGKDMITVSSPAYSGNDDSIMKETEEKYLSDLKKLPISAVVTAVSGEPLNLSFAYGDFAADVEGPTVEKALNRVTEEDEIKKQTGKLGDTCFILEDIEVFSSGDVFVPVKTLNELRRECATKLKEIILKDYDVRNRKRKVSPVPPMREKRDYDRNKPLVYVSDFEQFNAVAQKDSDFYIVCDAALFKNHNLEIIGTSTKYGKKLLFALPDIMRIRDEETVRSLVFDNDSDAVAGVFCNNAEALGFVLFNGYKKAVVAGPSLYVWNKAAYSFLESICDGIVGAYELSWKESSEVTDDFYNLVYGRIPLMNTANCVLKTAFSCRKTKDGNRVFLKDRMNAEFSVRTGCDFCFNTIYNSLPTSLHEEVTEGKIDRNNEFILFTVESGEESSQIIDAFMKSGTLPKKAYTKVYRKRGVE